MMAYRIASTAPVVLIFGALAWCYVYANTIPRRQPLVHAAASPVANVWCAYAARHARWPAPLSVRDLPYRHGQAAAIPASDILARLYLERVRAGGFGHMQVRALEARSTV
jgi:hypothetical protein